MKLILFFSVLSIFTLVHVCKAGPLRLHKRAAFYIANETACVVDDIVYSNGEPIPTEDPCEACKCRPPGFACVLKQCIIKPGCRAIRRLGECCPDYACGCEHNGRMYEDGEEIRDPKNPCYKCHCLGSSIACALVECFFRDDCDSEIVPGECCPKYVNCTREAPQEIPPSGGNVLPTINLLPALNDESVLPEELPSTPKAPEEPLDLTQPPLVSENAEEAKPPAEISSETSSRSQASETGSLETDESRLNFKNEEIVTEVNETSNDDKVILPEESGEDEEDTKTENETKVLFNSETNINEGDSSETTSTKENPPQSAEVLDIEESQTAVINEAEATEKSPEVESTSTDIPVNEQKIKNSAQENAKNLKFSNEDQSKEPEKKEEVQSSESEKTNKLEESETSSEASSETQTLESKDSSIDSTTKEIPTSPEATSFYSSNEKIKPESTETVTIIVHVNEKPKLTTETDYLVDEKATQHSTDETTKHPTDEAQGNLLKSSNELETSVGLDESSNAEKTESIVKNFEIFPTTESHDVEFTTKSAGKNFEIFPTTEPHDVELTTKSSSDDQKSGEVQARSDESDPIISEPVKNAENEDVSTDSKSEEDSSVTTSSQNISEVSEAKPEEVKEENKASDPAVTVIKIDPNGSVRIEITKDSKDEPQKPEEAVEKVEETKEETTPKETTEEKTQPEAREAESDPTKNEEKSTLLETVQESTTVQNAEQSKSAEQSKPAENTEQSTPLENVQSSTQADDLPEERAEETEAPKNTGTTETAVTEESIPEEISKSQDQGTEEPKQSE